MPIATVSELLDVLSELKEHREALRQEKQTERETILAPVKEELNTMEMKYQDWMNSLGAGNNGTEHNQGYGCFPGGFRKGKYLHAIYMQGRVSWDTKRLDSFSVAHPEILNFRK